LIIFLDSTTNELLEEIARKKIIDWAPAVSLYRRMWTNLKEFERTHKLRVCAKIMRMIMSILTSQTGFLPTVMGSLETQLGNVAVVNGVAAPLSTRQQFVAAVTASLFAAFVSILDEGIHTVLFVVKSPFVAIKEAIEVVTGPLERAPVALHASDWIKHLKKMHSSVVVFLNALSNGWADPEGMLLLGRRFNLMPPIPPVDPTKVPEAAATV
jgi:hypothetical protein